MAVRIRLRRMGARKRPFYRLVVADSRSARDGRIIETLGHYDPLTEPATVVVDAEKATNWINNGAQPSDTAKRLLKQVGVIGNGTESTVAEAEQEDQEEDVLQEDAGSEEDTREEGEASETDGSQ